MPPPRAAASWVAAKFYTGPRGPCARQLSGDDAKRFAGTHDATTVARVGWCVDTLRLFWGLIYWNLRKSWFRLRRGHASCPCQSPSDSGRALKTACDACLHWNRPERFRAVCPLLARTSDGLRCSADTADVRPFWGRALGMFAGTGFALYLTAAVTVFVFLRSIGYPVNIFHVTLPPYWHRVTEVRSGYFLNKSQVAFSEGKPAEALLYLDSAYQFDPRNQTAGLLLAQHLQVGQPARSDVIFQRLMEGQKEERHLIAQEWFRALLARGNFERVAELARAQIQSGAPGSSVWIRALVFARRRLPPLSEREARTEAALPAMAPWLPVFEVEKLLRAGRATEARAILTRDWSETPDEFEAFYQSTVLTELGDTFAALDALARKPGVTDGEVLLTARLGALAAGGKDRLLQQEIDRALSARLTPATLPLIKVITGHLIRWPDRALFARVLAKIEGERVPFTDQTAGIWFGVFCAAGAVGDEANLGRMSAFIRQSTGQPFLVLGATEAFFRGDSNERTILPFLPVLLVPLEVTYALLDRYTGREANLRGASSR